MRLDVAQFQGDGFCEVITSHGDEALTWSTGTYGKVRLNNPKTVFDEINGYWESLPKENQDGIWACYKEIKQLLDEMTEPFYVVKYLRELITQLYSFMPMDSFNRWLLSGRLYIPSDVHETRDNTGRYKNSDQTYLVDDYINLAVMALSLRPVIPIWGEYIDQGGQGSGNDLYKEMDAMGLISHTEIMNWPKEAPAIDKLEHYIQVPVKSEAITLSSLWRGMGSAEIPIWLLANVLVRRLTIVPLCDHENPQSVIAYVYKYIRSKLKPTERRTTDRVSEKRPEGGGRDEDDKTSLLEEYKVKQRIADGDSVLYSVYTENMAGIAQKVDPTMDLRLLEQTMQSLDRLGNVNVNPHQVRIAQWVLAKGFPPRAMSHIDKVSVNRLLVTAQALLWHWGCLEVASLMTVEGISMSDQNAPGLTHRPRPSTRISRKYIDELMELFPHVKPQRGKDTTLRNGNVAAIGINNVTREVMAGNWHYLGPLELKRLAGQPEGRGILVVPPTIKNNITEMVIHIAKLNQ